VIRWEGYEDKIVFISQWGYEVTSIFPSSSARRDYLFIPFTDATSGIDSYGAGRYIDCSVSEIRSGSLVLD